MGQVGLQGIPCVCLPLMVSQFVFLPRLSLSDAGLLPSKQLCNKEEVGT